MRASPTQQRAQETRERIIETAAQLFSERGLAETSTNRIAEAAHLSIGTLYRYFADKQQIVDELRSRLMAELEESFTQSVLASVVLPPEEGVVVGLRGITRALAERRALVLALMGQVSMGDSTVMSSMERRLILLTRAYLLHVLGESDDLDVKAYLMVTVGLATTARIGLQPPDLDPEELVEEVGRMLSAWLTAGR